MDYSNLFLNKESIENVLKISQKPTKSIGKGFASLVKSGGEKDAVQECNQCDYKTAIYNNMYQHNRVKHSDIKHKCTECDFTHAYPTKVKTHHKQVHLGVPKYRLICRKDSCRDVGKLECKELLHFLLVCAQCDFSTKRSDSLKIHTKTVHEGLVESFPCNQCDFITNLKSSLKRHKSGKHIEEAMRERYLCDYEGCAYKTLYKSGLRTHIETKHEGIVRFRCEFMNCTFGTNEIRHLKEHTMGHGEKTHKCNLCDQTFLMKRNYTKHIRRIHEGAGQLRCDYFDCTYGTYKKRFFEAHAVKHTGEKLYRCDLCDKMFATELYKKLHIKKVHNNKTKLCIKIMNTMEELPKSEPNQNPVSKSKVPTEEVQSENCAINDPTANKSRIIKSEMFGQISTHPTDLLCVQQLANTSKSAEPANGMLRKKLPEDKNDESCCKDDEPTIVKKITEKHKVTQ